MTNEYKPGPAQGRELWKNDCIKKPQLIPEQKIEQYLRDLPGWQLVSDGGKHFLERRFEFDSFDDADEFQQQFSRIVREQNHDPEEGVRVVGEGSRKPAVPLRFRTHSANGISLNDLIMAAKANYLFDERGWPPVSERN